MRARACILIRAKYAARNSIQLRATSVVVALSSRRCADASELPANCVTHRLIIKHIISVHCAITFGAMTSNACASSPTLTLPSQSLARLVVLHELAISFSVKSRCLVEKYVCRNKTDLPIHRELNQSLFASPSSVRQRSAAEYRVEEFPGNASIDPRHRGRLNQPLKRGVGREEGRKKRGIIKIEIELSPRKCKLVTRPLRLDRIPSSLRRFVFHCIS